MPIEFSCPRCQSAMRVPDTTAGQKTECPACGAKLRVPVPEGRLEAEAGIREPGGPAPAETAPTSVAAIEFACPRCQTAIRVRADEAGGKMACPNCAANLRVPVPQSTPQTADRPPLAAAILEIAQQASAIEDTGDTEEFEPVVPVTRRPRSMRLAIAIPLVCVIGLAIALVLLVWKPAPPLAGMLEGQRLSDGELGPFSFESKSLGRSRKQAAPLIEFLAENPLRVSSRMLEVEFLGAGSQVEVRVRTMGQTEFCLVDPRQNKRLSKYLAKNAARFEAARNEELSRSGPELAAAIDRLRDDPGGTQDLVELRNSAGLASTVRGLGYYVQAVVGGEGFPCVHEDAESRLYFVLPAGTTEFELRGRDPKSAARDAPRFPGRFRVKLPAEPITLRRERPDPAERLKRLLK